MNSKQVFCRDVAPHTIILVHPYHTICDALDKKVRIVFGEISKAFDSVSHICLLFKLQRIGIDSAVLCWFESYPSHRCFA